MRCSNKIAARWRAVKSQEGVTAIEYGLIAALIAVVIIIGVSALGTNIKLVFNSVAGKLTT